MLNEEQIKQLNRQRINEANREKAEVFKAKTDADAQNGWNEFLAKHSGQAAVIRKDVFHCNQANYQLLEEWILEQGLLVNAETLEQSYQANKSRLGGRSVPYERKTNTEMTFMPQQRTFGPPPLALPYTRKEILSWSKERLRWESRTAERLKALNAILANQA